MNRGQSPQPPVKQGYTKPETATQHVSLRGGVTKALPSFQPHTLTAHFATGPGHEATCAILTATHQYKSQRTKASTGGSLVFSFGVLFVLKVISVDAEY